LHAEAGEPTERNSVTTMTKKTYTMPLAKRTNVSATRRGRSVAGIVRRSASIWSMPSKDFPSVSSLAS